jgi:predicted aconitase
MREFARREGGMDAVYSQFSLDSDEVVAIPPVRTRAMHTQLGFAPDSAAAMGVDAATVQFYRRGEAYTSGLGIEAANTCTPYQVGNEPAFGEHCAWMESSAVVYCNSVLGARTNTEGRESVGAAMLTARIPYWGYHLDANRRGTHRIVLDGALDTVADWGLFGYWLGDQVQERVPVVEGVRTHPDLERLKHFGAAASSSGGVEMFHLAGITPEAPTLEAAFGSRVPRETLVYGAAQRRATHEKINATASETRVDYVMLGCPHYTLAQLRDAARLLDGRPLRAVVDTVEFY